MEKEKQIGIVGPQQLNPNKSIQRSCFRWHKFITPIYRRTFLGKIRMAQKELGRFEMKNFDYKSTKEVDWLLGSFLFCRADALEQVGLFDERYFMYFEDTDLCRRFWQKEWDVVYYPEVKIIHNHVRQSAEVPWYKFFTNPVARHHIISWLKYMQKWGVGTSNGKGH